MAEQRTPSAFEVFKGLRSNATNYAIAYNEKESGKIPEKELRSFAGEMAPDNFAKAHLQNKDTPISETYPFLEAGYNKFQRLSDKVGSENLEAIVDSTPKKNLRVGLSNINPDPNKAGEYSEAASNHKKYLEMDQVLAVYQDQDAEDGDREKAHKTILKKVRSYYDKVLSDDEPEVKWAINYLLEHSGIFAGNIYGMMHKEANYKFAVAIDGKERKYLKTVLSNDEPNRERFYQSIIIEPKKEEGKQQKMAA